MCWALVGAAVESWLRPHMRFAWLPAGMAASVLFGLYHFAHSTPFNTIGMVALLTGVGFVTSAFFFLSRDIYATIVFHNLLGVFGVVQALAASGRLETLDSKQPALMVMAAAAAVVLGLLDCVQFVSRPVASGKGSNSQPTAKPIRSRRMIS